MNSTDLTDTRWRKSSHSNGQANCVEAANAGDGNGLIAIRDSKAPARPALTFAPTTWRQFTVTLKAASITKPNT